VRKRFTAVFEDTGNGWVAQVEQIPGTRTQGRTLEEVLCRMGEAAELILAALEEREDIRAAGKPQREASDEGESSLTTF
jgi:predicted RNase H-like HicB family nuclease